MYGFDFQYWYPSEHSIRYSLNNNVIIFQKDQFDVRMFVRTSIENSNLDLVDSERNVDIFQEFYNDDIMRLLFRMVDKQNGKYVYEEIEFR